MAKLLATLDAVTAQPEAARFRFGVDNRWISGTQPEPDQHVLRRGRRAAARERVRHRGGPPRGAGRRGRRAVIRGDGTVALEGAALCSTMAITPDTPATAQPNVSRLTHLKATR
jgi:hypothetical protein